MQGAVDEDGHHYALELERKPIIFDTTHSVGPYKPTKDTFVLKFILLLAKLSLAYLSLSVSYRFLARKVTT